MLQIHTKKVNEKPDSVNLNNLNNFNLFFLDSGRDRDRDRNYDRKNRDRDYRR